MKSFATLASFAVLVAAAQAAATPPLHKRDCTETASSTITVGQNTVDITVLTCPPVSGVQANGFGNPFDPPHFPPPPPTTVHSSTPSATPTPAPPPDVCDQICTDTCSSDGGLPPDSEDCETIVDAITILNGSTSPTFVVNGSSIQQLTFGTCRFYFENITPNPVEYCWLSLSNTASAAFTACFPPIQPVQDIGLCTPSSGAWVVGVGHS